MDTVVRIAAAAGRILRSRLFAVTVLAVVSAIMVTMVSVNMRAVTVSDGDSSRVVLTMNDDPQEVLAVAGYSLSDGDRVKANMDAGQIDIDRAFNVHVTADGTTTVVRMTDGTVGEALAKVGVEVGENDTLSHEAAEAVSDGMEICIERVAYREYTKTEKINFTTKVKYTNTLAKGKTKILQAGKAGVKTYLYRERIVEGEAVETSLVSEKVTTQPVEKIILKGTVTGTPMSPAPFDIALDEAGQPLQYKKVFTGKATAYSSEEATVGTRTASGRKAQVGVVAVDPRKIPYGTKLYIVSPDGSYVYGYAIAGDTGGGVRSGALVTDLYMDTIQECLQFGRRTMNVYVLE